LSIKRRVFKAIITKIVFSNWGWLSILKNQRRKRSFGGWIFLMGADLRTRSLRSIHSLCYSVSKSLPPILSFSVWKFETTTPTKRLRKKKNPMIMKRMKKKLQNGDL
jgi:hypothetical protein